MGSLNKKFTFASEFKTSDAFFFFYFLIELEKIMWLYCFA